MPKYGVWGRRPLHISSFFCTRYGTDTNAPAPPFKKKKKTECTDVYIDGFSASAPFTVHVREDDGSSQTRCTASFKNAMRTQEKARRDLVSERIRIMKLREEERSKKKGGENEEGAHEDESGVDQELELRFLVHVPSVTAWPVLDAEEQNVVGTGLPRFPLIMQVDMLPNVFNQETSVTAFQQNLGPLPAMALLVLNKELYKTTEANNKTIESFPKDVFLGPPERLTPYERWERFKPGKFDMSNFMQAGYYSSQLTRMMDVIRQNDNPYAKFELLNEYFACTVSQVKSDALQNNMRSNHTKNVQRNLVKGDKTVCPDLVALIKHVFDKELATEDAADVSIEDQSWASNENCINFWNRMQTSYFLATTWIVEEMHKRNNDEGAMLTAANMKILADTRLSSIGWRLGEHNGVISMGHPTTAINAGGKTQVRIPNTTFMTRETRKSPSVGLDTVREKRDQVSACPSSLSSGFLSVRPHSLNFPATF